MSSRFGAKMDILSHSPPSVLFQRYSTVFSSLESKGAAIGSTVPQLLEKSLFGDDA